MRLFGWFWTSRPSAALFEAKGAKKTSAFNPMVPSHAFQKGSRIVLTSFELAIQARSNDAFAFRVLFGTKVWGGFGNLWLFRCLKLTKGSKALEKNIRIQPNGPFPNGPKGPRRGPLGPSPTGPRAPWARRALLLSSKGRSDITTERECDGATIRRSDFIRVGGYARQRKESSPNHPKSSRIGLKPIPKDRS